MKIVYGIYGILIFILIKINSEYIQYNIWHMTYQVFMIIKKYWAAKKKPNSGHVFFAVQYLNYGFILTFRYIVPLSSEYIFHTSLLWI